MHTNLESVTSDICFFLAQQFHAQGKFTDAAYWYERALAVADENIEAHEGMMYALSELRMFKEVIPHATAAMNSPDADKRDLAQYNRGLCYLMTGDYQNGFKDYDTRMRMGKTVDTLRRKIGTRPLWGGKPCDHLLVYGEQGMGDLFMFSRYINVLSDSGLAKKITFEVPREMVSFMHRNFGSFAEVVEQTEEITPSDEHILLVSLARIFDTNIDKIPYSCSYLKAENKYIEKWKNISALPGMKVGLCWAGRSEAVQDIQVTEWNSRRSIQLKQLEPVLNLPGISFVSLQKGVDEARLKDFPHIYNYGSNIQSWSDTAGIMHHLDLVISIDSGPVHLAGAMGKSTWLLNHVHTCWRWNLKGDKAPWYDSIKVYRQEQAGDWELAIEKIFDDLVKMIELREAA